MSFTKKKKKSESTGRTFLLWKKKSQIQKSLNLEISSQSYTALSSSTRTEAASWSLGIHGQGQHSFTGQLFQYVLELERPGEQADVHSYTQPRNWPYTGRVWWILYEISFFSLFYFIYLFIYLFIYFCFLGPHPQHNGSSQARGRIGATVTGQRHTRSIVGSQPTEPGQWSNSTFSRMLVRYFSAEPLWELPV